MYGNAAAPPPSTSESLSVSSPLSLSPDHCTIFVHCCHPPPRNDGDGDIDDDPPGHHRKTRMKTHICCLNDADPSPSSLHEACGAPLWSPPLSAAPTCPSSDIASATLDPSSSSSSSSHVTSAATPSWQSTFCQIPNFCGLGHAQSPPCLAS